MAGIFRGLFDDASLFPPASLAMGDAVTGHLRHQAADYLANIVNRHRPRTPLAFDRRVRSHRQRQ